MLGGVAAALTLTLGCTAEVGDSAPDEDVAQTEQGIEGGYEDAADVAVVGLAVTDDSGHIYRTCSGTLIAPNLVLTAQHCVASTAKFVQCDNSVFGQPVDAEHVLITTGASMWDEGTAWYGAVSVEVPPGIPTVCGRDLALVILRSPLPIAPIPPRLDGNLSHGETYTAIGYGKTHDFLNDAGRRHRRDGLHITCISSSCDGHVEGDEWRGDHGICSGDSGGPAIDEQGLVIGVTSRGPLGCDDPIYGGLAAWGGWVTLVAERAATIGGYDMPNWNNGTQTSALTARGSAAEGSCSYAPVTGVGGATAAGLFLLALLSLGRRGRTKAR
jgi:hypothetical protein